MSRGTLIRTLLSEPNRMHRDLLQKDFYAFRDRFKIIACAESTPEILSALEMHRPEVAIISCDLQDGPLAGIRVVPVIRSCYPSTKILTVMASSDRDLVVDAFKSGTHGVFCRYDLFDRLCKAIEVISQGYIWASSEELHYVLDAFAMSPERLKVDARVETLVTKRESAVIALAMEGHSNHGIAVQLGLTEHAVKNYLSRIFDKLGVSDRLELVLFCLCQEENREFGGEKKMPPSPRKALPPVRSIVAG